jgi:predicted dinucleotide-binding enzyme
MKIGIIGTGNIGVALGRCWARNGHQLMLSFSRDPVKLSSAAASIGAGTKIGTPAEAAAFGGVVVLATPYHVSFAALHAAGPLKGKILFSCVNPLKPDMSGLAVGTTTSGAEELAKQVPGARFVEGLPLFAEILNAASPRTKPELPTVFYCGDDAQANAVVASLLRETGAEPVSAGPLSSARYLEPAMMLLVHLAYPLGAGPVAFKLLRANHRKETP